MKKVLGRDIGKQLIAILGLPKWTTDVTISIKTSEPVRITCTYLADKETLLKTFELLGEFKLHIPTESNEQGVTLPSTVPRSLEEDWVEPMSLCALFDMAVELAMAIERNTGEEVWFPPKRMSIHAIQEAHAVFQGLIQTHGIGWLIDAARGTGMSHIAYSQWSQEVCSL